MGGSKQATPSASPDAKAANQPPINASSSDEEAFIKQFLADAEKESGRQITAPNLARLQLALDPGCSWKIQRGGTKGSIPEVGAGSDARQISAPDAALDIIAEQERARAHAHAFRQIERPPGVHGNKPTREATHAPGQGHIEGGGIANVGERAKVGVLERLVHLVVDIEHLLGRVRVHIHASVPPARELVELLAQLGKVLRGDGELVPDGLCKRLELGEGQLAVVILVVAVDKVVEVVDEARVDRRRIAESVHASERGALDAQMAVDLQRLEMALVRQQLGHPARKGAHGNARRPQDLGCRLDTGGAAAAHDEAEQALALLGRRGGERGHFEVIQDVRADLACVADGFEVEAVFETRHAVGARYASHRHDQTIIGHIDALAARLLAFCRRLATTQLLAVPVVAADHVDFEQTLLSALVRRLVLAHHHIRRKALDVVSVDAREQLAERLDERARLDGAYSGRRQERVEEVVVVGRDERHVVPLRVERLEQAHGGPSTTDDDEPLLGGQVLAHLILLVFRIGGYDGEVLGPASVRSERERVERHLVDVRLAIGERVVCEDDGGGGGEAKDDRADRVSGDAHDAANQTRCLAGGRGRCLLERRRGVGDARCGGESTREQLRWRQTQPEACAAQRRGRCDHVADAEGGCRL
ncbi:hypothetical protein L1887_62440 [Cichorium endivia]|nr:hypothetical protein L1887_62440 [Cichorium endivia]